MKKRVPLAIAAALAACGVAATADNAADSAQTSAKRDKQGAAKIDPVKEHLDLLRATEGGGMPGCFDPSLSGRPRAVAERLGGVPCDSGAGGSDAGSSDSWPGIYDGESDGGSLMVTVKDGTAPNRFPVSVEVIGDGGCGGEVSGTGVVSGNKMALIARVPNIGEMCRMVLTRSGSNLHVQEGSSCHYFHGLSCEFTGNAERRRQAVRQSVPVRASPSLVGVWMPTGQSCAGDTALFLDADGSYTAQASESGRWQLAGDTISFTATETFVMGEPGSEEPVRNAKPERYRLVSRSANSFTMLHPDGRRVTLTRCR